MKKFYLLTFSICFMTFSTVWAQKSFMKYGKIDEEELKMTSYANDTSAGAVVLGDYGVTRFAISEDEGFYLTYTRHIRIKILKKTAFDWADFIIRLYVGQGGRDEEVTMLKGCTYKLENGKAVKYKLGRSAIFRETEDKNHKVVKFSMPNVREGSVLDVSYSVSSPFTFTLNSWYFQKTIPVKRSEYHVFVPEYYYYKNWTTGYIPIVKNSDTRTENYQFTKGAEITPDGREKGGIVNFNAQVTHWSYLAENVPAFIKEPYMTTIYDYLSVVEFELVSTNFPGSIRKSYTSKWEDINRELMDDYDFGRQLDNTGHLKDQIELITSSTTDPEMQMILAYEHIKNHMVWDNRYRIWPTESIRKAYNEGNGSTADINLNLVALLKGLGLNANPVLVSTRSNGKVKPGQVILTQFNHVIACVNINNRTYALDAIDHFCPHYILPPNSLNGNGMMISSAGYKWIDLYSDIPDTQLIFVQASLNDDFELEGNYTRNVKNFSALRLRKEIKELTEVEKYKEELEKEHAGLEVSNLKIDNLDSIYTPLKLEFDILLSDRITEGGDRIYFVPVILGRWEENPFKNEERNFPVDFNYPIQTKYSATISIPDGYEVEELPESLIINLLGEGGKFMYEVKALEKQIIVNYDLTVNQTIFPSMNYKELKKFFEKMVSKQSEQVVLKKII